MSFDRAAIEEEVRHWFFEVYFSHWVEVGAGRRRRRRRSTSRAAS